MAAGAEYEAVPESHELHPHDGAGAYPAVHVEHELHGAHALHGEAHVEHVEHALTGAYETA